MSNGVPLSPIAIMVQKVAESICEKKDNIRIKELEGSQSVIIDLVVDKSDLGKMIGRNGRIANAVRSLIYASAFRSKKKYFLQISSNHKEEN